MARAPQDRLLHLLARDGGWTTAGMLADRLGVTPRTIRSYVMAINARVPGGTAIESGPNGYRAGSDASSALRAGAAEVDTPRDRLHALVRSLLSAPDGIDLFETADGLFVSPATLEADLARVRELLATTGLTLERSASRARLLGTEMAQRRLLSSLAHDEMDEHTFDLEALRRTLGDASLGTQAFGPMKTELVAELGGQGYFVNEIGISDVVMHIAIAADRVTRDRSIDQKAQELLPGQEEIAEFLAELVDRHLGVDLGSGDLQHLSTLVLTRVVAPGEPSPRERTRALLDPEVESAVRDVVHIASTEFLVDLGHEDFILRLALHVQNVRHRARERAWSRNSLTKSLKSTYPMIFEVAVFVASALHSRLSLPLPDDEIAYIAMHIGGRLERNRRAEHLLTATIVCPGYYELHEVLRSSVNRSLGQAIEVVGVETRDDPDWDAFETDLVITTIDPPDQSDRFVRIHPFLTDSDIDRVFAAAARMRRTRRLARLRGELERYFVGSAFVSGLAAHTSEEEVIRQLGSLLVAEGVIDNDYIERTIQREQLSSTAFTDALAVPHAIGMTATRTAIAIGIADTSIAWGQSRVQVIAMVAFSESDREAFQTVFEQFVEVFSERESVERILKASTDMAGFLSELVAVIDN